MKSLPIDRPTLDDPIYDQKNPYQVFILVFTLVAVLPKLAGGTSPSQVMESNVSEDALLLWMICLLMGSIIGLIGEFWRGHTWTSLAVERAGLILVAVPGLIFAWYAASAVPDANYIVGVTSAYSFASLWRCIQITKRLRWIRQIVDQYNRQVDRDNDRQP